ncbi:hypothetical protein SPI_05405 [Niveomyces insectorum RCEF 264]|uniref:EGF domain-specific O-linked N-acetylglucosamine transferase n=1 Tax=Niveomyces insectorum RCEF 264 TaxID=1081102 RepID=A0A167T6T7_9HYPO|nr:hypothetical protein SPI_05405 [Niveomyces insectorum RCEF 264]
MGTTRLLSMHPRVLCMTAWPVVVLSLLVLLYVYHVDSLSPGTTWNRISEHVSSLIRPSFCAACNASATTPAHVLAAAQDTLDDFFAPPSGYQQRCTKEFGIDYLRLTAQRRTEFCTDPATASLLCFHARGVDPLCVARGAAVRAKSASDANTLSVSMPCSLRNFTEERAQSEAANAALHGIQNVEDIHAYYFNTGAGVQLREWHFLPSAEAESVAAASLCAKDSNDGRWYLFARREGNNNIWHKLMEIWQATLSVNALRLAIDPDTGAPLLTKAQRDAVQVVFEDDREEYLDPAWTMVSGLPPIRRRDLPTPFCPGHVILPLAGSSSPFWTFLIETDQHEPCQTRTLMDFLLPRLLTALGVPNPRKPTDVHVHPVVTIVDRKKTRVFADLDAHVARLRQRNPNVTFHVVDFAAIPLAEQIRVMQGSDVLVGHHGAGMTQMLFMPAGTTVVEIFPAPQFPILGFRHVALMLGQMHIVGHSVWKEQYYAAVNGTPIPTDWTPPLYDTKWQRAPVSYVLPEDFVALVEAAIRSQTFKSSKLWE